MDTRKQKLRKYLDEQSLSWQILFGMCFFKRTGLLKTGVEFDIFDAVKFAQDEQDFETIYEIIEFLNFHKDEIVQMLYKLHFKPALWQQEWVEKISSAVGVKIPQTIDETSLIIAYGYALLLPEINFDSLYDELDAKYIRLYNSASDKMKKLKRNFVLSLECMLWPEKNADDLSFRELLDLYVPKAGTAEVIRVYKHALSEDVKLSAEERECWGAADYFPLLEEEISVSDNFMPEDIFASDDDNDDDYGDDAYYDDFSEDNDSFEHFPMYVDTSQRCIVDEVLCGNHFCNVYIERQPQEKFNCSLPDFIGCCKGRLYTVEFVDNIKDVAAAQELNCFMEQTAKEVKCLYEQLRYVDEMSVYERFITEHKLNLLADRLCCCFYFIP